MKKIEPLILNRNFDKLGVCDDYSSLIWASRYYTTGDFEICCPINEKHNEMFKKGHYIVREDDENVGIVENLQKVTLEDLNEMYIVSGRFLSSILSKRIIEKQTQLNTSVSTGIYTLISNEAIAPIDERRRIPNLLYGDFNKTDRLKVQYTGDNLLNAIELICETYGIGHKTTLTKQNGFLFQLYEGVDRSLDQSVNTRAIFSDEYDNLLSTEYVENYQDIVTDVLVAGEGEGLERKTLWVNSDASGLDRVEKYVDKRDLSTNEGQITDSEYYAQLNEVGLENITSFTSKFTGTVAFGNIEYKKDVNLGDICSIVNTKWGIYINTRLVEVIESVDGTGRYTITPTFGV